MALGWEGAVSTCCDACVIHPNSPTGQSRGLVHTGSPVICVASYSTWAEAGMAGDSVSQEEKNKSSGAGEN